MGVFPLFIKMVADGIDKKLSFIFRWQSRWGSFPDSWRSSNVTAIPKGAPSPDIDNYRPTSITLILPKVYEKLVLTRSPVHARIFFPASQFPYWKGLGCTDALITIAHHVQNP